METQKNYEHKISQLLKYNFSCYNCKKHTLRATILDKSSINSSDDFPFCYACYRETFPFSMKLNLQESLGTFLEDRHLLLLEDHRPGIDKDEYQKNKRRVSISPYDNVYISDHWFSHRSGATHGLAVVSPENCLGLKYLNEVYKETGSYPILLVKQYLTPPDIRSETYFMHYIALMTPELNILSYHLSKCFLTYYF